MSPPLRVPLEVLERILFFAFAPLSSPSSSSLPVTSKDLLAPPLGTSHLLIISKGVRQLALPLYYSIISIVDSGDWSTFLDPPKGLLVGEDNEERASFVKELWMNVAIQAKIPMDYAVIRKAVQDFRPPDRILVELKQVVLPDLDLLQLFLCGNHPYSYRLESKATHQIRYGEDGRLDKVWEDATTLSVAEEFLESDAIHACPHDAEDPSETEAFKEFYDRRLQTLFSQSSLPSTEELEEQAESEREETTMDLFLNLQHPPRTVQVGLDALGEVIFDDLEEHGLAAELLVVSPPTGLHFEEEDDARTTLDAFYTHRFLKHALDAALEFKGFPKSFWELARGKYKFCLGEDWTWRAEDGRLMGLKEALMEASRLASSSLS